MKKLHNHSTALIALFTLFCGLLITFSNTYSQGNKFVKFTKDDGLLASSITDIKQDTNNFIWIATVNGLCRFNGYEFKAYQYSENNTNSIKHNFVTSISFDTKNTMFVGTRAGISEYISEQDHFVDAFDISGYAFEIKQDIYGNYYILRGGHIISIYDSLRTPIGSIGNLGQSKIENHWFESEKVTAFMCDSKGNIWLGTATEGLHIINILTKEVVSFTHTPDNPYSLANGSVVSLFEDVDTDIVWIGCTNGLSKASLQSKAIITVPIENNSTYGYKGARIKDFSKDKSGRIWLAQSASGIGYFNVNNDRFVEFNNNEFDVNSVSSGDFSNVMVDKQGNIWSGGINSNLNLKYIEIKNFEHFRRIPGIENTLSTNEIFCMEEDDSKNIWIGTNEGINIYNPSTDNITIYSPDNELENSIPNKRIVSLHKDSNGDMWVGSFRGGLQKWSGLGNDFISYGLADRDTFTLPHPIIKGLAQDSEGIFWCGTNGKGVFSFNPATGETQIFNSKLNKNNWRKTQIGDFIGNIYVDENDIVYVGGAGFAVIDAKNEKLTCYSNKAETNDQVLAGRNVTSVLDDNKGGLWLTTTGGLSYFDKLTRTITNYGEEAGLPVGLHGVLPDETGSLWISSNEGLFKFVPETGEINRYDKTDGLQSNEFTSGCALKSTNGKFYFAGINGVTHFYPNEIRSNYEKPKMHLTNIKLFNDYLKIGESSILEKDLKYQDEITLKHNQNVITIEYVGLNYFQSHKNQYKYIMEGFDKDWQEAGNSRAAIYTNLNPGKYTFKVIGSNNDGEWSETPATLDIRVKPPIWRTKLAFIIYVVLLVYLITLFVQWRARKDKKDKEILQQKIDEAKDELEKQKKELEEQKREIARRDEAEKEIRFINAGLAKFGDIIDKDRTNLDKLHFNIIRELTKYVGAKSGAIFTSKIEPSGETTLRARSSFAYVSSTENEGINPGEGFVGSCFKDSKRIIIDNLPEDYVKLESGLGKTVLSFLVLVPIKNEDETLGVIEVAANQVISDYKIDFIEKIGLSIGSTLAISRANRKANEMLEQNRVQQEELRAQEEEMRQTIEEMQATHEENQRKEDQMTKDISFKEELIESLKDEIKLLKEELERK